MKWHYNTPPFKVAFTPINGEEGAWVLVPLSCASNRPIVVQTGFVNSASKRGSEDPSDRENF